MHVVICGGGVIGAAAAYELSRRDCMVTLVERWRVAGAASGKSGGFLARDWCDGTPVAELAHRSFDLHGIWSARLGNPYGYRTVDTFGAAMDARRPVQGSRADVRPDWLARQTLGHARLGDAKTTAQLDPSAFTTSLMQAAVNNGSRLAIGSVVGLMTTSDETAASGVELADGQQIEADAVIVAMGPWSLLAAKWVPLPPVYALKGHSLVFQPDEPLSPETVFAEFRHQDGDVYTPEIVTRADGTVYICGLSGTAPLPVDPSEVIPEAGGCELLHDISVQLVPALKTARVIAKQACYRPVTADGMPLIGPVAGRSGLYIATGHSVWGMLNAPGTAEALAELIVDGATSHVSLAPFVPSRLAPLDPADLDMRRR